MTAILKVDTIQDTSGNNIINENSNTITIGASGDTTNIIGTLQNNGSALNFATVNGITEADQWRLTSNLSASGTNLTSNLERNDTSFAYIGSGMTESSGVFTFPSTGIYLIDYNVSANATSAGDIRYSGGKIQATTNDSAYSDMGETYNGCNNHGSPYYFSSNVKIFFDVTNTSTHKVKFYVGSSATVNFQGSTSEQRTSMTFIRLGDTWWQIENI